MPFRKRIKPGAVTDRFRNDNGVATKPLHPRDGAPARWPSRPGRRRNARGGRRTGRPGRAARHNANNAAVSAVPRSCGPRDRRSATGSAAGSAPCSSGFPHGRRANGTGGGRAGRRAGASPNHRMRTKNEQPAGPRSADRPPGGARRGFGAASGLVLGPDPPVPRPGHKAPRDQPARGVLGRPPAVQAPPGLEGVGIVPGQGQRNGDLVRWHRGVLVRCMAGNVPRARWFPRAAGVAAAARVLDHRPVLANRERDPSWPSCFSMPS